MSDPYVGEIRMFGGNFAPAGWMFCEGQVLAISEYEALYNLIATTYGGNGQTTFALPDLRGRVPLHAGGAFLPGQSGGTETVTLNSTQYPVHTHPFAASTTAGTQSTPPGNTVAASVGGSAYVQAAPGTALDPGSILSYQGGNGPHDNMQPYQCVSFIISLSGIFPSG